jgi:hypothetical protein
MAKPKKPKPLTDAEKHKLAALAKERSRRIQGPPKVPTVERATRVQLVRIKAPIITHSHTRALPPRSLPGPNSRGYNSAKFARTVLQWVCNHYLTTALLCFTKTSGTRLKLIGPMNIA